MTKCVFKAFKVLISHLRYDVICEVGYWKRRGNRAFKVFFIINPKFAAISFVRIFKERLPLMLCCPGEA